MSATFSKLSQAYLSSSPSVAPLARKSAWLRPFGLPNASVTLSAVFSATHTVRGFSTTLTFEGSVSGPSFAFSVSCSSVSAPFQMRTSS